MGQPLFEKFLSTSTMLEAEYELIKMGGNAIPILESLLNGEAKNEAGVPYRNLGLPLRCALETIRRLGNVAKPLEPLLTKELANGKSVAAMALGSLGSLDPVSISILANSLDGDLKLAYESAAALVRCREADNEVVLGRIHQSERAASIMFKVRKSLDNRS